MILKWHTFKKIKKFEWHWYEEQTILTQPPNKVTDSQAIQPHTTKPKTNVYHVGRTNTT